MRGGTPLRTAPFPRYPFFDKREAEALVEVVRSGNWWGRNEGSHVEQFEQAFGAFQDCAHCICTTSCTVALTLALTAVGIEQGDEVIVPAYTFVSTAAAVLDCGAVPVFADIEPGSYNVDVADVERKISSRTKIILPVHIGGRPADMDAIQTLADLHSLKVVEDAAQAHGAAWRNRRVGGLGDAGCFSFHVSKNITAGEGGALTTDDASIADAFWSLHNCGRMRGGDRYLHPELGSTHRMTEWQGAVLNVQLSRLDNHTEKRTRNAGQLEAQLRDIYGVSPLDPDERVTSNSYHLFMFRYDASEFNGASKELFVEALRAEGIPASPGYKPVYREQVFQGDALRSHPYANLLDYSETNCPVTEKVCNQEAVWLTQNVMMAEPDDMMDIVSAISKIRENRHELVG